MQALSSKGLVEKVWDDSIVPTLCKYIEIPNKSPLFDPQWQEHGHMDKAVALIEEWCRNAGVQGLKIEVVRLEGRTPLIFMEVPGQSDETILLYGHLDKQPEMVGWNEGLGPWTPVLKNGRLYGRGGADDGYAAFASLTAIRALQEAGRKHARCVVMIEAGEESGSPDLPAYIEKLSDRIGKPDLVICLDSGCGDYERLWATTSLRGMIVAHVRVDILTEGVHSGDAGGVVPSSFRILRRLLERLEDSETGKILPSECHVDIPAQRQQQAQAVARVLGSAVHDKFPFVDGARPMASDSSELILNRTWRPSLAITGMDGVPSIASGGNVLRPFTAAKVSLRLPPTADARKAYEAVEKLFTQDVPYGAKVHFEGDHANGWSAPPVAPWLEKSMAEASRTYFGQDAVYMGEGGSIPFMGMLGERYPEAQFLITGVLGPSSNAHGPNEFLDIEYAKKLTCCVAQVIDDHFHRTR